MAKEILCGFGVDVDAVAGWLGSYGGEDSPDDISRGLFAGEVGSPRLLKLFARLGIKTTWFIPGHSRRKDLTVRRQRLIHVAKKLNRMTCSVALSELLP